MESLLYDSSDLTRYYKSSRLATTRNNNFFFQIQISWCNCEGKGIARCPWLPDLYTGWLPRYRVSCNVHYKALIMRHRCDSLWPPWTRLLQLQQWRPSSRLAFSLQTFHLVVNLISTVCVCVCVHMCVYMHMWCSHRHFEMQAPQTTLCAIWGLSRQGTSKPMQSSSKPLWTKAKPSRNTAVRWAQCHKRE